MQEKTDRASEQNQSLPFTITGEDEAAQRALLAEKPAKEEPAAAQPNEKKPAAKTTDAYIPWLVGALAVVVIAALLLTGVIPGLRKPTADQPTLSEPAASEEEAETPTAPETDPDADAEPDAETDPDAETPTEEAGPAGNGVSYTVTADELTDELLDQTVATCGDDRLTNRELPYYYWQQYYTVASTYGSYLGYLLDPNTPFDQQMCMYDETITWQQYFLQTALSTYERISSIWQDARLAGFELGDEDRDYIDGLENNLNIAALSYGYEDAAAYLQTAYGPSATMSGYRAYVERYLTASAYLQSLVDAQGYTDADISAYFDENADAYAANGIEKSDVNMINVRHILIQPTETNEDGSYTDAAWEEAEKAAQAVYDEWKNGERTEAAFALLAAENSVDSSASNGGLIENVYPGQMVETFDAWCFDASRQSGDTDVVKSPFGYHVMYFSSECEHPYWYVCAQNDYLSQLSADFAQQAADKFGGEQTIDNAALVDIVQG